MNESTQWIKGNSPKADVSTSSNTVSGENTKRQRGRPKGSVAKQKLTQLTPEREARRKLAESSLEEFIKLIHPLRLLGDIHREVISWLTSEGASSHQLLLLPRDHGKSALAAYLAAWLLTRDPTLRILYISSTANLATKQLKFIKDILTSSIYRQYWPDMVNKDEAKREKWNEREIAVDHPRRKEEYIRDPSIFTAGLTTNIIGLHCDVDILDDVVVAKNTYEENLREKVKDQYSFLTSVEGAGARQVVVGTRYHPDDLYSDLMQMEIEEFDSKTGEYSNKRSLFDIKEYPVENVGDGTGEFLWPRQQRYDGKWFGFDAKILHEKKIKYINQTHFRAQYYNDPRDTESAPINRNLFQYYDRSWLNHDKGKWFYKGHRLNIYAAVDFAFSLEKTADSSAIVVVGIDGYKNYYVLDIDRFKTGSISEYFKHILQLYEKWGFHKIRAEVSVAQSVIVNDLKENYIRPMGLSLAVDEHRPSRWQGAKEERILASLEPKYANRQVWHYHGGNCQVLEDELIYRNPPHDDVKDALAACVDNEFCIAPINLFSIRKDSVPQTQYHQRFGGVA
jgi:hypothetical protein